MSLCNMSRYSCYVLKGSRDHGKPGIRGFKWPYMISRELEHLNGDIYSKSKEKNVVILRFIIYIYIYYYFFKFMFVFCFHWDKTVER